MPSPVEILLAKKRAAAAKETPLLQRGLRGLPCAVLDLETTSKYPEEARIVQVSVVHVDLGEEPQVALDLLVNPGVPIPEEASSIHGITDDQVEHGPEWPELAEDVRNALHGRFPMAYNGIYDFRVIEHNNRRAGIDWRVPAWLDPLVWAKHVDQYESGKRLGDVARRRGYTIDAHGAAGDAVCTAMLAVDLLRDLGRGKRRIVPKAFATVESFLWWQNAAALGQERELTQFFAKQGRAEPPDCPWHAWLGEEPPPWKAPPSKVRPCSTCGAPVVWLVTRSGERMPLDPEIRELLITARHPKDARKKSVTTDDGTTYRGWFFPGGTPEPREGERVVAGRESHFACPEANKHRRAS